MIEPTTLLTPLGASLLNPTNPSLALLVQSCFCHDLMGLNRGYIMVLVSLEGKCYKYLGP